MAAKRRPDEDDDPLSIRKKGPSRGMLIGVAVVGVAVVLLTCTCGVGIGVGVWMQRDSTAAKLPGSWRGRFVLAGQPLDVTYTFNKDGSFRQDMFNMFGQKMPPVGGRLAHGKRPSGDRLEQRRLSRKRPSTGSTTARWTTASWTTPTACKSTRRRRSSGSEGGLTFFTRSSLQREAPGLSRRSDRVSPRGIRALSRPLQSTNRYRRDSIPDFPGTLSSRP